MYLYRLFTKLVITVAKCQQASQKHEDENFKVNYLIVDET